MSRVDPTSRPRRSIRKTTKRRRDMIPPTIPPYIPPAIPHIENTHPYHYPSPASYLPRNQQFVDHSAHSHPQPSLLRHSNDVDRTERAQDWLSQADLTPRRWPEVQYMAKKKSKARLRRERRRANAQQTSERAATASTAGPSTAEVSSTLPTTETETERTARVEPITKPSDAITQEGATTVEQLAAELAKLVSLVDSVNLPPVYTYSLFIYHEPYGLGRRSATRATPGFNRALAVGVMDSERMGAVLSKIKPLEMLGLRDVYRSLFDRDLMDDVRDNKVGLVVRQDPEEEIRTINHDFMGARYEPPSDRAVTILKAVGVPTQEQLDTLSPSVAATGSVTSSGMTGNDELSGRAFH